MKLSEKIIYLRKKSGMSQEQLANELNVSRQSVSRWEVGSALPDALNILNLSKLFDVSADYLLNDDYEEKHLKDSKLSRRKIECIVGLGMISLSIIWCFILGILSLIYPSVAYRYVGGQEMQYTGVTGYVLVYEAQWIVGLILLLVFGGVLCLIYPKILAALKKAKDKGIIF